MKLSLQSVGQHLNGVKSFIQRGYHNAKGFAGSVDHAVSIARRTYSALSPFLDQLGVSHTPAMKALQGYDEIKSRAMQAHNRGEQAYQTVRQTVPEFNFA